ncbi:glycosyl transferase family 1, partial [bacterium]|nr:glycosyl transferase family 1 [bacterium]
MRVLFASGIDGFCHRYEVLHRAEQVRAAGGEATVVSFLDPRLDALLDRHDVLVLYRVPETSAVASAIERARGSGLAVVGAIDDLVFVDDPALFPELAVRPDEERALWFEGLRRYRATLERCDVVVVS